MGGFEGQTDTWTAPKHWPSNRLRKFRKNREFSKPSGHCWGNTGESLSPHIGVRGVSRRSTQPSRSAVAGRSRCGPAVAGRPRCGWSTPLWLVDPAVAGRACCGRSLTEPLGRPTGLPYRWRPSVGGFGGVRDPRRTEGSETRAEQWPNSVTVISWQMLMAFPRCFRSANRGSNAG